MSNKKVDEIKGLKVYTSRPWELIKTSFLVVTWIVLGIHLELVGPTLNILRFQTGVEYTQISNILISRGAGYMFGNIVGALIQKPVKNYPEGLLSLAFLLASIVVVVTPVITNIHLLSFIFFFQGISQGITDLGGTSLMLAMWGDYVSAPLNVVHLGYGFGAVFANLFVKPFLRKDQNILSTNNSTIAMKTESPLNIQTPYSIAAALCLVISIGHLIFSIREYQLRSKALRNRPVNYSTVSTTIGGVETKEVEIKTMSQYSPRSCGNGYFNYGLSMSIVWILYMFFLSGNDLTFNKFFFAFLKTDKFQISTTDATSFMIVYWLSYSIGRLICAVITVFLPVHIAISGLWICGLILAIAWSIFVWVATLTSTSLLILGAFTGLVFSPTFPLSFGFINQRLNVNPLLVGCLLCGGALGGMSFQKLGGIVLDRDPDGKYFPTLLIVCVVMAIILFIIALILSSTHQKKVNATKKLQQNRRIGDEEQQMEIYLTNDQQ